MHPTHIPQQGTEQDSHWLRQLTGGHEQRFAAGDMIVRPDSFTEKGVNQVFLVAEGEGRVYLNGEQRELTLGWLKPGSLYVTHTPAWVEAQTDCTIISWPIRELSALFASRPELAPAALREVGMMLQGAIDVIEDLAFRPVELRLVRYLLLESENQCSDSIQLTGHTELLASLSVSWLTLSTLINRLVRDGILLREGKQGLRILDRFRLEQLSAS